MSAVTATDLFGIRSILAGGQPGFITTNSPGDAALRDAAREVQTIAALSPAGPYFCIADPAGGKLPQYTNAPTLNIGGGPAFLRVDPRLAELSPDQAIRFAELVIAEARKDSRVAIDRAEFSVNLGYSAIRNSNGIVASNTRRKSMLVDPISGAVKTATTARLPKPSWTSHTRRRRSPLATGAAAVSADTAMGSGP